MAASDTAPPSQAEHPASQQRARVVAGVAAGLLVALLFVVLLHRAGSADGFSTVGPSSGDWAYAGIFLFVVADAICALFPSETVLNAGSALAADGYLSLGLVILAGAAGAVVGDSALYWIARGARTKVKRQLDNATRGAQVSSALAFLGSSAPVLLVAGRYVPGLRFVVNASLGLSAYPYRRFLLWSSVGGTTWSIYTCTLAYLVGTTLAGFPLATVVISGSITTCALLLVFVVLRRRRRAQPESQTAG